MTMDAEPFATAPAEHEMIWSWLQQRFGGQPNPPDPTAAEGRSESRELAEGGTHIIWRDAAGRTHSEAAEIEDASPVGLGIRTATEFHPGQDILLGPDESRLRRAVVRHCVQRDEATWRVGVRIIDSERRRVVRETIREGTATIRSLNAGQEVFVLAKILDISEFGAQLETKDPLPLNERVCLTGEQTECLGVVRYCKKTGPSYRSGLQFVHDPYEPDSVADDWLD